MDKDVLSSRAASITASQIQQAASGNTPAAQATGVGKLATGATSLSTTGLATSRGESIPPQGQAGAHGCVRASVAPARPAGNGPSRFGSPRRAAYVPQLRHPPALPSVRGMHHRMRRDATHGCQPRHAP
jgi:hypothetical protein